MNTSSSKTTDYSDFPYDLFYAFMRIQRFRVKPGTAPKAGTYIRFYGQGFGVYEVVGKAFKEYGTVTKDDSGKFPAYDGDTRDWKINVRYYSNWHNGLFSRKYYVSDFTLHGSAYKYNSEVLAVIKALIGTKYACSIEHLCLPGHSDFSWHAGYQERQAHLNSVYHDYDEGEKYAGIRFEGDEVYNSHYNPV